MARRRGFVLGLLFVLGFYVLVGVILLVFGIRLLPAIAAASGVFVWVALGAVYLTEARRIGDYRRVWILGAVGLVTLATVLLITGLIYVMHRHRLDGAVVGWLGALGCLIAAAQIMRYLRRTGH